MYIDKTNEVMMNYYKKQEILKAKQRLDQERMPIVQVLQLADKEFITIDELLEALYIDKEEVFVGVGSDDVLAVAFMTFFNGKKPIFFPDITYSFYPVWAELFGIPYEKKAVNDAFEIQKEDYYAENGGVVFPNPNAPTGAFLSLEVVEDIIQHNQDVVVIVDEAYIDFGGDTAKELTRKYDNVLVVQTYSKSPPVFFYHS